MKSRLRALLMSCLSFGLVLAVWLTPSDAVACGAVVYNRLTTPVDGAALTADRPMLAITHGRTFRDLDAPPSAPTLRGEDGEPRALEVVTFLLEADGSTLWLYRPAAPLQPGNYTLQPAPASEFEEGSFEFDAPPATFEILPPTASDDATEQVIDVVHRRSILVEDLDQGACEFFPHTEVVEYTVPPALVAQVAVTTASLVFEDGTEERQVVLSRSTEAAGESETGRRSAFVFTHAPVRCVELELWTHAGDRIAAPSTCAPDVCAISTRSTEGARVQEDVACSEEDTASAFASSQPSAPRAVAPSLGGCHGGGASTAAPLLLLFALFGRVRRRVVA